MLSCLLVISTSGHPSQIYLKERAHFTKTGLFCPFSQLSLITECHNSVTGEKNWIKRCYVTVELYTGVPAGFYLAVKLLLLFKQGGAFLDLSVVCLWLTSAPSGSPCGLRKCKGYSLVSKRVYGAWGFLLFLLVHEWILLHNCDIGGLVQQLFMMSREACTAA